LSLHHVSVCYGAVQALSDVDLAIRPGEIKALLGENGAGKSTLMNAMYGLVEIDRGQLVWEGDPLHISGPRDARRIGIGMVHQEFTLIDALSVAENLGLVVTDDRGGGEGWLIDYAGVRRAAKTRASQLGLDIGDLDARVGGLPVGVRQRIEILKAMLTDVRLLILDEPTAVLTPDEIEQLFSVLRSLRDRGVAVVLITHKLREAIGLADSVTILRTGHVVAERQPAQTSEDELAQLMVGRVVTNPPTRRPADTSYAAPALLATGLCTPSAAGCAGLDNLDLNMPAGRIYGIAGVDGNGQQQLFDVLSGMREPLHGEIRLDGKLLEEHTPNAFSAAGVSVVAPERRRDGAVLDMQLWENAILDVDLLRRHSHGWTVDRSAAEEFTRGLIDTYGIVCSGTAATAASLSGGNLQKLIVGRALARRPRLLVAFNPTRGLDVGATGEVYKALGEATTSGSAVLLISTDLEEVLSLSDDLSVLFHGRLSPPSSPPYDRARIGQMMGGAAPDSPRVRG